MNAEAMLTLARSRMGRRQMNRVQAWVAQSRAMALQHGIYSPAFERALTAAANALHAQAANLLDAGRVLETLR